MCVRDEAPAVITPNPSNNSYMHISLFESGGRNCLVPCGRGPRLSCNDLVLPLATGSILNPVELSELGTGPYMYMKLRIGGDLKWDPPSQIQPIHSDNQSPQ